MSKGAFNSVSRPSSGDGRPDRRHGRARPPQGTRDRRQLRGAALSAGLFSQWREVIGNHSGQRLAERTRTRLGPSYPHLIQWQRKPGLHPEMLRDVHVQTLLYGSRHDVKARRCGTRPYRIGPGGDRDKGSRRTTWVFRGATRLYERAHVCIRWGTKKPRAQGRGPGDKRDPGPSGPGYPLREEKRVKDLSSCTSRLWAPEKVPSGPHPSFCPPRTRR